MNSSRGRSRSRSRERTCDTNYFRRYNRRRSKRSPGKTYKTSPRRRINRSRSRSPTRHTRGILLVNSAYRNSSSTNVTTSHDVRSGHTVSREHRESPPPKHENYKLIERSEYIDVEAKEGEMACPICVTNKIVIVGACGHTLCSHCSSQVTKMSEMNQSLCPMCRESWTDLRRIFT